MSQRALAGATALLAVSDTYLQWGLHRGERQRTVWDKVTPHGYDRPPRCTDTERSAAAYWDQFDLADAKLRCCFFGSLGTSCDLSPFLEAMRILDATGVHGVELVVCGDGPKRDAYRRQSAGINSVRWVDWIDQPKIAELMRRSHIGIAAYSASAPQSLPNKPIEYLAGGLGVISTLAGSDLEVLLAETRAGVTFRSPSRHAIASQFVALRDNPFALQALKTSALAAFAERFEADKVYGDLAEHLLALRQSSVMSRAA
jgi:glycosyltransferase involved in cell wall biosynthesis